MGQRRWWRDVGSRAKPALSSKMSSLQETNTYNCLRCDPYNFFLYLLFPLIELNQKSLLDFFTLYKSSRPGILLTGWNRLHPDGWMDVL